MPMPLTTTTATATISSSNKKATAPDSNSSVAEAECQQQHYGQPGKCHHHQQQQDGTAAAIAAALSKSECHTLINNSNSSSRRNASSRGKQEWSGTKNADEHRCHYCWHCSGEERQARQRPTTPMAHFPADGGILQQQHRVPCLLSIILLLTFFFFILSVLAGPTQAQGLNDPSTQYVEGRMAGRRVWWCPSGYGYLAYCPQPTDWDNYNWCCTFPYMGSWKPSCCPFAIPTGAVITIIIASIVMVGVLVGLSCWCCWFCPLYKQLYESEEEEGGEFVLENEQQLQQQQEQQ